MKLAAIPALLPFFFAAAFAENWPQWRGPSANSVSGEKDLPVHWTSAENISWKLPLPARSGSTPVIWGDRIFINVAENGSLYLWCVDRKGPQVEWKKLLGDGDYMVRKQNMSSPSPVTDGKNVWVLTGTGVLRAMKSGAATFRRTTADSA